MVGTKRTYVESTQGAEGQEDLLELRNIIKGMESQKKRMCTGQGILGSSVGALGPSTKGRQAQGTTAMAASAVGTSAVSTSAMGASAMGASGNGAQG